MLKRLENESNQLNQSQSHDKFSLELEIERIQRDLQNSNQESQALKDQTVSLKNQISKFQAAVSSLVRLLYPFLSSNHHFSMDAFLSTFSILRMH